MSKFDVDDLFRAGGEVRLDRDLDIIAIAGSLRKDSFNRALLAAVQDVAPDGVNIDVVDIAGIPLYNQDLENDRDRPPPVEALKTAVSGADGLLLATPEYNFGISGVMKNVVDWVSRPAMRSPLAHKPVGIIGASTGAMGTARAQEHLKTVVLSTLAIVFPHAGVVVGNASTKFADGRLTDESTRKFLREYLEQFASWIQQVSAAQPA